MRYSLSQIAEMDDHQITVAVAAKLKLEYREEEFGVFVAVKQKGANIVSLEGVFKPCENWNDVMPIAVDNNISVDFENGRAVVFDDFMDVELSPRGIQPLICLESENHNIKRAVCEVFLTL